MSIRAQEISTSERDSGLSEEQRLMRQRCREFVDEVVTPFIRNASIFLHMDATADISRLKIVKALWPDSAGAYAGPEG